MTKLKTVLVQACKNVFNDAYPEEDFRNIHASIEYPIKEMHYPGIWVDFQPTAQLRRAGIDHHERQPVVLPDQSGAFGKVTRWLFNGYATFTIATMSSFERDRLHDEMIRVIAFADEEPEIRAFRDTIEQNDYLAMQFDFDEIGTQGFTANPGTPWNTDEIIYECTITMECFGEFTSTANGIMVPLSAIHLYPYADTEPDPLPGSDWV